MCAGLSLCAFDHSCCRHDALCLPLSVFFFFHVFTFFLLTNKCNVPGIASKMLPLFFFLLFLLKVDEEVLLCFSFFVLFFFLFRSSSSISE